MRKPLSKITRKEWVAFRWIEVSEFGDKERMFVVDGDRTPTEGVQAAEEWDIFRSILDEEERTDG